MSSVNYLKFSKDCIEFEAGEVIFNQGDEGDIMYGVISGEVRIEFDEQVIDVVKEGGVVGEMALVGDTTRSATVIAGTDCTLTPVDHKQFLWLVHETPTFATQVMNVMAERIRRLHTLVS